MYTPNLSDQSVVAVRRLAWALGLPMTKTLDIVVRLIPTVIDQRKICSACNNETKCPVCAFNNPLTPQEQSALLAAL